MVHFMRMFNPSWFYAILANYSGTGTSLILTKIFGELSLFQGEIYMKLGLGQVSVLTNQVSLFQGYSL